MSVASPMANFLAAAVPVVIAVWTVDIDRTADAGTEVIIGFRGRRKQGEMVIGSVGSGIGLGNGVEVGAASRCVVVIEMMIFLNWRKRCGRWQ